MSSLMPKGTRQLLLPASPTFIWLSIFLAFILNIVENFVLGGWVAWAPDFLAVTLVFLELASTAACWYECRFHIWTSHGRPSNNAFRSTCTVLHATQLYR